MIWGFPPYFWKRPNVFHPPAPRNAGSQKFPLPTTPKLTENFTLPKGCCSIPETLSVWSTKLHLACTRDHSSRWACGTLRFHRMQPLFHFRGHQSSCEHCSPRSPGKMSCDILRRKLEKFDVKKHWADKKLEGFAIRIRNVFSDYGRVHQLRALKMYPTKAWENPWKFDEPFGCGTCWSWTVQNIGSNSSQLTLQ